ncbi:hypothetical protein CLAFUW4_13606 [Fulvia fulva]|uniref:Uncharacterized protein n=1 Tax=Passalora fulva TaxID=5499 RepID=A0A9Q8PKI8_PASFU|nr:uncharacterized protein CLAFUR5_13458 [Fulvia fulva]KAK4610595.1 hypothetical protein CLAFUR4_13609 [Fulvia fulva]KAK4611248.1 hypothetical protein CLAFUR0_13614 [Fulvia fulva]UJO24153.1 hypothetical protein CLAFUR5_13458 [Fulvia fulva]WPV22273.1 hypothetical protein CLAFUW4_13606 [Fulvia fulva]WPV36697.1 hypothetical protein CLAFUW7_13614 [Fulvia fulva]
MTSRNTSKHVHFDASTENYTSANSRGSATYDRISSQYCPGRYASPEGYEKEDYSFWDRGIEIEEGPDIYDKGRRILDPAIARLRARERAMWLDDVVYNEALDNSSLAAGSN